MNTISFEETKKMVGNTFETNLKNILLWGGFFSVSLLVYYFISSGDFSFLLVSSLWVLCYGILSIWYYFINIVITLTIHIVTYIIDVRLFHEVFRVWNIELSHVDC